MCTNCIVNQRGLEFQHITVGSYFATSQFPTARIKKLDSYGGIIEGGEGVPIEAIGLVQQFDRHDRVMPYNYV